MTLREKIAYLDKVNKRSLDKALKCLTVGDMIGYNDHVHKAMSANLLKQEFEKAQRN